MRSNLVRLEEFGDGLQTHIYGVLVTISVGTGFVILGVRVQMINKFVELIHILHIAGHNCVFDIVHNAIVTLNVLGILMKFRGLGILQSVEGAEENGGFDFVHEYIIHRIGGHVGV